MKKILYIGAILSFCLSTSSFATVDAHDSAFIVVEDIQSNEFFVERVPIIGCYGYGQIRGPQLIQFTAEYKVTSNIGCGGDVFYDNINYLTCAKVVSSKPAVGDAGFSKITLDISKCAAKNNSKFIAIVGAAAKLNFPLKNGAVTLDFVK